MTDTLLVGAVAALKARITAAAATATPEELAYLGTAIDRISGRATAMEVEAIGDEKIAELEALAESAAVAPIQEIVEAASSATTAINSAAQNAETAINSTANTAIDGVQQAANLISQQLGFGRKLYFYGQL